MCTPKRPAAPPRGTRSLRRLQHANSLRREKSKKLTGELAKAIFSPEQPQKPRPTDLQLVWQDVFDYEGAPHPARWQFQCEANDWVHDAQHGALRLAERHRAGAGRVGEVVFCSFPHWIGVRPDDAWRRSTPSSTPRKLR